MDPKKRNTFPGLTSSRESGFLGNSDSALGKASYFDVHRQRTVQPATEVPRLQSRKFCPGSQYLLMVLGQPRYLIPLVT